MSLWINLLPTFLEGKEKGQVKYIFKLTMVMAMVNVSAFQFPKTIIFLHS